MQRSPSALPIARRALIAALLWVVAPAWIRAQSPAAPMIVGVVVDSAAGVGIAGAEVALEGTMTRVMTDQRGHFRLPGGVADAGTGRLRVRRLGFAPRTIAATGGTDDEPLRIALTATFQPLAAVLVHGERARYAGRLAGYYQRLEQHSAGQFITRIEMERENLTQLSQVLRRAPGVSVGGARSGGRGGTANSVRMRGLNCPPLVWLDGAQMGSGDVDVDSFSPSSLEGVELYLSASSTPGQYQASRGRSECGTILLWSRGRDTEPRAVGQGVRPEQLEELLASRQVYTTEQVDSAAVLDTLTMPSATYPPLMRATGTNGIVIAEFVVDSSGAVEPETVGIVSSSGPLFSDAVREVIQSATFRPAIRSGRPVRQLVRQPFEFHAPRTERGRP
jgi:TonB family protein